VHEIDYETKRMGEAECLLLGCAEVADLFSTELDFHVERAQNEEVALSSIAASLKANKKFHFILVDLDDSALLLPRFMGSVNKLCEKEKDKIDVYAIAAATPRIEKICREFKVSLLSKPVTLEKIKHLVPLYKPDSEALSARSAR